MGGGVVRQAINVAMRREVVMNADEQAQVAFRNASYPIHEAAREHDLEAVKAAVAANRAGIDAVEYEAEVNGLIPEYGVAGAYAAVRAEVKRSHLTWTTPFGAAAEVGNVAIVDYLLREGANPDIVLRGQCDFPRYREQQYPLGIAAERGHVDVVRHLLVGGAAVHGPGHDCIVDGAKLWLHPPLSFAARCMNGRAAEIINLLLANCALPNVRAGCDIAPIHWAAERRLADAITALIDGGADPNAIAFRVTPLIDGDADPNANALRVTALDLVFSPVWYNHVAPSEDPRVVAAYDALRSRGAKYLAEIDDEAGEPAMHRKNDSEAAIAVARFGISATSR